MRSAAAETISDSASVLVVDDERGPRESLQLILNPHFQVHEADRGEKALDVIRSHAIDVVTLDLKMNGLSGQETLARIREIDPDLEVIVVTGYGSFESAIEVLRLRAFDYIPKPFESRQILDVVRRAVDSRHHRLQASRTGRIVQPLSQIIHEIEGWPQDPSTHLSDLDRNSLEQILWRLRSLRSHLGTRSLSDSEGAPRGLGKDEE